MAKAFAWSLTKQVPNWFEADWSWTTKEGTDFLACLQQLGYSSTLVLPVTVVTLFYQNLTLIKIWKVFTTDSLVILCNIVMANTCTVQNKYMYTM